MKHYQGKKCNWKDIEVPLGKSCIVTRTTPLRSKIELLLWHENSRRCNARQAQVDDVHKILYFRVFIT